MGSFHVEQSEEDLEAAKNNRWLQRQTAPIDFGDGLKEAAATQWMGNDLDDGFAR